VKSGSETHKVIGILDAGMPLTSAQVGVLKFPSLLTDMALE
jgi:hypothetical protein